MKKIGLIGGMSWESTNTYYKMLNQGVSERLGGLHSADIIMQSYNFKPIEEMQRKGAWDDLGDKLADTAKMLQDNGADIVVLATNTMHKVAPAIEDKITVPFVHIADATAEAIKAQNLSSIGLYGTSYTMEQDFYKQRLIDQGIHVDIPMDVERPRINQVIFDELCKGKITPMARKDFVDAGFRMMKNGAQGLVFGCTEINMLIKQGHFPVPVFDTTEIHVKKVLDLALS